MDQKFQSGKKFIEKGGFKKAKITKRKKNDELALLKISLNLAITQLKVYCQQKGIEFQEDWKISIKRPFFEATGIKSVTKRKDKSRQPEFEEVVHLTPNSPEQQECCSKSNSSLSSSSALRSDLDLINIERFDSNETKSRSKPSEEGKTPKNGQELVAKRTVLLKQLTMMTTEKMNKEKEAQDGRKQYPVSHFEEEEPQKEYGKLKQMEKMYLGKKTLNLASEDVKKEEEDYLGLFNEEETLEGDGVPKREESKQKLRKSKKGSGRHSKGRLEEFKEKQRIKMMNYHQQVTTKTMSSGTQYRTGPARNPTISSNSDKMFSYMR